MTIEGELPQLNRALVCAPGFRARTDVLAPSPEMLELQEKAVQFGTGAFLRGFVEYFLDEANRQGRFGGRLVMIGSTGSGRDRVLAEQDGLYTLRVQGMEGGELRQESRVIGAVSRALSAKDEWTEVLACARSPELELVFSNTTEVGIALDEGDADAGASPPRSFPGKLARFLYERACACDFDPDRGVIVIPCELIEDNGDRLREIVLALAARWGLDPAFAGWIEAAVPFCNTLVDRIVPGAPAPEEAARLQRALGYRDELLTTAEVYRLFVIQGDEALRRRLRFAAADPGVVVTEDVAPYRERKVWLLNGTHTAMVPLALLAGCETVLDAMRHERIGRFVQRIVFEEVVPSLGAPGAEEFARAVLDRFSNPYIRHALFDITLQGTTKLRVRVVPSIVEYARRTGRAPRGLALGFAAYLLFMRGELQERRRAAGHTVPADEPGQRIHALWNGVDGGDEARLAELVRAACADESLWGADLTRVPGFADAVTESLVHLARDGAAAAVGAYLDTGASHG